MNKSIPRPKTIWKLKSKEYRLKRDIALCRRYLPKTSAPPSPVRTTFTYFLASLDIKEEGLADGSGNGSSYAATILGKSFLRSGLISNTLWRVPYIFVTISASGLSSTLSSFFLQGSSRLNNISSATKHLSSYIGLWITYNACCDRSALMTRRAVTTIKAST